MKNESGEKPGKCVMHQTDSGKVALTLRALWCYYKQFLLINYVLCIGLCIERFSLKHDHCLLLRPLCDMCPVIRYKRMCVICSQSKTPIDYGGNLRWTGLLYWWSSHAVSCCRHPCAILLIWSSGLKHDNIFFYFFFFRRVTRMSRMETRVQATIAKKQVILHKASQRSLLLS